MTITSALDYDALRMARKALEQQYCGDAISRQAAIRIAEQGQVQGYEWQFKELVKLPSVTPQTLTECDDEDAEIYSDVFEIDADYLGHDVTKVRDRYGEV